MRVIRTIALFVVVGFFSTFSAIAQYWPIPASTPAVDVKCAGCIGGKNNLLTPGYPATLSGFTGRFLDSQATQDIQQPFRTSRAFYVYPARSRGRIYMIIGSAVFAYDINTFFTRLAGNESLVYANTVPVTNPGNWGLRNGTVMDKFLRWDSFFYAENENNGWITPVNDGQERLFWLDYDDQGYVYLAYSVFGWGIVKDDGTNSGNIMQSVYQNTENAFDTVNPFAIMSVKSSAGHYYALVGGGSTVWNVFDVSNRSAPIRQSSISRGILSFSKNGTSDRIAIVTSDRSKVQIFTSDALVVGGAPLVEFTAPGGNLFKSVTSDGTNFYADASASAGTTISTFAPSGSTYTRTDYTVSRSDLNALKYGDGYLLSIANTNGAGNLIIYKLVGGAPVEIPTADYFQRYYISNPDSHYVTPSFHSFYDSTIMKSGTKVYLIATAYSLGDVYELPSTDSVSVTNLGASGTINSSRPTDSGVGPFYGDPVAFKATTGAATPMNVQWDFGNPEASASADPNAATGITGTTITHRYSGVTSASLLPITRTVRATNTSDSSITSTASVTL